MVEGKKRERKKKHVRVGKKKAGAAFRKDENQSNVNKESGKKRASSGSVMQIHWPSVRLSNLKAPRLGHCLHAFHKAQRGEIYAARSR